MASIQTPPYTGVGTIIGSARVAAGATWDLIPTGYAGSSTQAIADAGVGVPMETCTLVKLRVMHHALITVNPTVITVYKNGVATALTVSMPVNDPALTVASVSASVAFAAGDLLTVHIANPGALQVVSWEIT